MYGVKICKSKMFDKNIRKMEIILYCHLTHEMIKYYFNGDVVG